MNFSRTQIAIAAGAGLLVLFGFFGYLMWLNGQPPVLARSAEVDPLTKVPESIKLNPLRDRSSERSANEFLRAMRDGHCHDQLSDWEKDYRKKYAAFVCESEATHPLLAWRIVDWEDRPPLRILNYRANRRNEGSTYQELLSVTLDNRSGEWAVTKYDSLY
ncbi:MAG TPA: hypothetical protein VIL63_06300 [Terriglobales bacterium]